LKGAEVKAMASSPDNPASCVPTTGVTFTPELQMANMLGLCEAQMD